MTGSKILRRDLTCTQVLSLLAETPFRISTLTAGLRMAQLHTEPKPGEWSPNAVLAHLRACADVGGSAIQTILVQEEPTLRAVNPRKWVHEMGYLTKRFQPSLCAFAKQRAGLVSILGPLPPEAWLRSIRVTGNGRRLERSILSYGQWLANHERVHLEQLERSAKRLRT